MTQLTLESLAERIVALEQKVAELTQAKAPAIRPGDGDTASARDQFYAEAARFPGTEAEFAAQKELYRRWRADSAFEPYWQLLDRLLAHDFADMQKSRALADAARRIREAGTYDFDAVRDQDECDLRHAHDHLP
jgi:hypothetical protein